MINTFLWIIVLLLAIASVALFLIPAHQPKTIDEKRTLENSIAEWRLVQLGGWPQWVSIRSTNKNNPILLFLHGGPGTSETPFLIKYNSDLEKSFMVVSWDQRGAGKSYSNDIPPETMNIDQFISDTHELTQYLQGVYGREKIYLVGHSWGTLLGLRTAHRYPEDYYALISIAQTSDGHQEELLTYLEVLERAKQSNHRKAIQELEDIGLPESGRYKDGDKSLGVKMKWVRYFGGAAFHHERSIWLLIQDVLTTPVYTFREKLNYPRGEAFTLEFIHDEVQDVKLTDEIQTLDVPIYFLHGIYDNQVPISIAKEFFGRISAPRKRFYQFDNSAHGVLFEEPEKFNEIMIEILEETKAK